MGKKRKRPVRDGRATEGFSQTGNINSSGCFRNHNASSPEKAAEHSHPVISLYYPQVVTLKQYLLKQIPISSKLRRRKITSVHNDPSIKENEDGCLGGFRTQDLANLLDTTLVGVLKELSPTLAQERRRDFAEYTLSQSQFRSQLTGTGIGPACAQSEIVDFVISSVFNRTPFSYQKPQHLLAHGFQRASGPDAQEDGDLACSIPGLVIQFPNKNVQTLKQAPWTEVLGLLGANGEEIMMRLLLDCGIFIAIDHRKGIYYQISGLPLSILEPIDKALPREDSDPQRVASLFTKKVETPGLNQKNAGKKSSKMNAKEVVHKPNSIVFFRRRMLYARPALSSKGEIQSGLRKLHVLNRFPSSDSLPQTVHVMKYIFPRQFGLHNVFTSTTNSRETVLPFKDYFSREDEIAQTEEQKRTRHQRTGPELTKVSEEQNRSIKIPKRLRGKPVELVQQLQKRNKSCPYVELLRYYCPTTCTGPWKLGPVHPQSDMSCSAPESSASEALITQPPYHRPSSNSIPRAFPETQPKSQQSDPDSEPTAVKPTISRPKLSLTDYATPSSSVSAFCRAVLRKLIPPQFYGAGQYREINQNIIFKHVDRFVRMRRFESLSLHEVCKGIKITCMPWLEPPNFQKHELLSQSKLSLFDLQKRTELLHEFIYYLIDSILIPLIRTHFYVSESQTHRNRLFYFRHDVWRRLTEQPLAGLKSSLFEEMKQNDAERRLSRRSLGYSSLRLLPKTTGVRPILNLRRRVLVKNNWAGKAPFLGPSINSTVTPVYNVLNYERTQNPTSLGSSLQFVGEIHSRLKRFKEHLLQRQTENPRQLPLYFVRLDIQSCFDTIPQEKLIPLIESLVPEEAYQITKHVEIRPPDEFNSMWPSHESRQNKALRKFAGRAAPASQPQHLTETVANGGISRRRNTIFVDALAQKEYTGDELLDLLDEHVRYNLVKIGRKFFRQRTGIPQGSVLSSILCNLFYAEMEREVLGFLQSDEAMLLRLVDDFLLVTPDSSLAMRFLQVMVKGQPAYGISVNPAKSLVNFAATVEGVQIPRLVGTSLFPYCGCLIDTKTLEICKDQDRILEGEDSAAAMISNSLTVESTRAPGRSLHRKVLASFKLHLYPMYLDTKHNSLTVVLSSLYAIFVTSAMKMYRYMKSLQGRAHPTPQVVIRVIKDLMQLAHRLIQARRGPNLQASEPADSSSPSMYIVQQSQVHYLASAAFRFVLSRKQTRYAGVLHWLDQVWKTARPKSDARAVRLAQIVQNGNSTFAGWRF